MNNEEGLAELPNPRSFEISEHLKVRREDLKDRSKWKHSKFTLSPTTKLPTTFPPPAETSAPSSSAMTSVPKLKAPYQLWVMVHSLTGIYSLVALQKRQTTDKWQNRNGRQSKNEHPSEDDTADPEGLAGHIRKRTGPLEKIHSLIR